MLRSINEIQGYTVHASDGHIGGVDRFFFDDEKWTIRYIVVDTGTWLPGRQVLISPISIGEANFSGQQFNVSLTREQVERSPDIDTHKPVSRQREMEHANYFGYPYYWGAGGLWGAGMYPGGLAVPTGAAYAGMGYPDRVGLASGYSVTETKPQATSTEQQGDPHLRSTKEVIGYHIEARDGEIGHVEDFIIDDESWAVRYMVVDTSNWWLGKKVPVSPQWIKEVSWADSTVSVDISREEIERAPEFDPSALVSREYEDKLHSHYGRSNPRV